MARENQIRRDDDDDEYTCISCDREFNSEHSLLQHCQNASIHKGEWCDRCEWLFVSTNARSSHINDSLNHWACNFCNEDLTSEDALISHQARAHQYCRGCGQKFSSYAQHRIDQHYRCQDCNQEFENHNNLVMHSQVHLPTDKECYGCTRHFAQHSAIMIHLESGTCPCRVSNAMIDEWAFNCYQSKHYTNDRNSALRFRCPTCQTDISRVSGLFQHVESPACDAGYDGAVGKLRKFLENQISRLEVSASDSSGY